MNSIDTDLVSIVADKGLLRPRRIWYVLAIALAVLSFVVQVPLLFLAAFLALFVGWLPDLWYRTALRHVVVRCTASQQRLFFGEEVTLICSIENQKWLPLPWLRTESNLSPPMTVQSHQIQRRERISQIASTWQMWSFQRVIRRYPLISRARGCYTLGPVTLRSSDPFGWLESTITLPIRETVLVYPLIVPVESGGFPPVSPFGEHVAQRHLMEDPLRVAGVREYQLGDDPRRIHWKATAHAGTLRSKIYEYSTMRRMLIVLDTRNYSHSWMGVDAELQELTISAAASIAVWALEEGCMVGLLANSGIMVEPGAGDEVLFTEEPVDEDVGSATYYLSSPGVRVPFALDEGQYERLLSLLARLVPRHTIPVEDMIEMEQRMFQPGTTVVLVSAAMAVSEETAGQLLNMRKRGVAVHFALTGTGGDAANIEVYGLPVHHLGGREQWHELIEAAHDSKSSTTGITAIHSMAFRLD